eukprot:Gb_08646 [translate_table: standard]
MAAPLRPVATLGGSPSLDEARRRALGFFKQACRSLPAIMDIYNLYEVITTSQLRSIIASEFRKHADVTNPKVIDMLLFKGEEELRNCVEHAKQRHHIVGQYVIGRGGLIQPNLGVVDHGGSEFLKKFYESNNF